MKKIILTTLILILGSFNSVAQEKYTLIIDSVSNTFNDDVSFPYWLNSTQTVRPGPNVKSVSIIEFKIDTATNNNLVFQKVISLKTWGKVPAGKVWKIESIGVSPEIITGATIFNSPRIFNTPGTYTWMVPPGVTSITVEVWGAGGNGYNGGTSVGNGGGGGGYGIQTFQVTPNTTYLIKVGDSNDSSKFGNNLIVAFPGTNATSTAVGLGGSASSIYKVNGDNGGYNSLTCQSANGGNGGNGGSGGRPLAYYGSPCYTSTVGNAPGGGGSGGAYTLGNPSGAPGQVIIHW